MTQRMVLHSLRAADVRDRAATTPVGWTLAVHARRSLAGGLVAGPIAGLIAGLIAGRGAR
jgi:hypothetical protein